MSKGVAYKAIENRPTNVQYRNLLVRILNNGDEVDSQQEEATLRIVGHQMRFLLVDGFPIITERDLLGSSKKELSDFDNSVFSQALGELFGFLAGAHTQESLKRFGCRWWKPWVTKEKCAKRELEEGDLGPGSYGPAWTAFPTVEGIPFNQIQHLVEQIREYPHLRTHFVSPWIPQYIGRGKDKQQRVVVAPCHGWLHFFVDRQRRMTLHHFQRSADVPVGLVANLIQYAALLMMVAQITDCQPYELVYTISDTHIYLKQMEDVKDMLNTQPMILPTVKLEDGINHLCDFRQSHFKVTDYHPQLSRRRIWTPV